jgi:Permuted papain-like amidase enzyme, YaeF/YiiX, C92 family
MIWFYGLMIVLGKAEQGAAEATDWMKPATWTGNFWGPAATRARLTGQLPPLPTNGSMMRWNSWGRSLLREGDIVFRLGDARTLRGTFPLSRFIARATGSAFSHTGIVAIENGSPVVYDCSSAGVQRQPFEVWMLDCIGDIGVKRLKPEYRNQIPGVIAYCRSKFEQQVPFDYEFRLDDTAFYCVELTEKAFRSQGLVLSQPVRIGDWEHLETYPLTALATPYVTRLMLKHPITLEQPVYLPGNEHQGLWASSLLETVVRPEPKPEREAAHPRDNRLSLRGDLELAVFASGELRRAYADLQVPQGVRIQRAVSGDDRRSETPPIAIDDHAPRHVR